MKQKAYETLAETMTAKPGKDFTLDAIYRIVCRPPHQEMMTTEQLHSRCGRAISEARRKLATQGYIVVQGNLRHSYRAVRRDR